MSIRALFLIVALAFPIITFAQPTYLWQIGTPDNSSAEFALSKQGFGAFKSDPMFIVGTSQAEKDFPFIQPGPDDGWAGSQKHTFSIVFGVHKTKDAGECIVSIALANTHPTSPPLLDVIVNGHATRKQTPPGASDPKDNGPTDAGKPFRFDVAVSVDDLKEGANLIDIVSEKGSWVQYDWIAMSITPGITLSKVNSFNDVTVIPIRALIERDGKTFQPVQLDVRHAGAKTTAKVQISGGASREIELQTGTQTFELLTPAVAEATDTSLSFVTTDDKRDFPITLKPVRKLTLFVLPHSHHDLGYTEMQPTVQKKQIENLKQAMEIAKKTAAYPEGARFVWNTEALWSVDDYMTRLSDSEKTELAAAVKDGHVALNAMYGNTLTGLCRPEELLQLFRYSTRVSQQLGVTTDSAMQSDVPGMTWGTATAMAQAGVKYFSLAPNYFDRIGSIMFTWQDKPFWWKSRSGDGKVLVWVPFTGYALSHIHPSLTPTLISTYLDRLDTMQYPYDISYVRWSGHGDNAAPDEAICEFIKGWNTKYSWPKLVISSTHTAFAAMEAKYGEKLPTYSGDLTPYWEDGAASSAAETKLSRSASERLAQADALFAMLHPEKFASEQFASAWRDVLLYSEHTWGAWCSVSNSESAFTKDQWTFKREFAVDAAKKADELIAKAIAGDGATGSGIDVFNTSSWTRTELVIVSKELSSAGDRVVDSAGKEVPSQRLTTGELAVWASDIPAFAGKRFTISAGLAGETRTPSLVTETVLDNGILHVRVDPSNGSIIELSRKGSENNFATTDQESLNGFAYLAGANLDDLKGAGNVTITAVEKGPLVSSLKIESVSPGCNKLTRELRLVAGSDQLEILNTIDKQRVALNPDMGKGGPGSEFAQRKSKESVSFVFPFHVPDGQIRLNAPMAVVRPEADQLPGACKNWLPVGRWADVSNDREGITLATVDAPLVEIGKLSTLLGSQSTPKPWRKAIEPTQEIFSWVMNNHWGTNYCAYQEGIVSFRYALRPHGAFDGADAERFGVSQSQPMVVRQAVGDSPSGKPIFTVSPADVLVETLKPSDDGKATIVRLYGASGEKRSAKMDWPGRKIWISALSENPVTAADGFIEVPGHEIVTLRLEKP